MFGQEKARAVLSTLGEIGKTTGEVIFDTGIFLIKKRWRFKAILNKVTLRKNREGHLRLYFSCYYFFLKPTGLVKYFTPATSQGMEKYNITLRLQPSAGIYSVQILLELNFVNEQKAKLVLSQNVQWTDVTRREALKCEKTLWFQPVD